MNKKLQKEILAIVKKYNNDKEKGPAWTGLKEEILKQLKSYDTVAINHNLNLLKDSGKIVMPHQYDGPQTYYYGNIEITNLGYEVFHPWHIKFWKFFTNDLAKILSIIFSIVSIISIILSIMAIKNGK